MAAKLAAALAVFIAILLMPTPEGLTLHGQRSLAVMTFVVVLWATEAVHSSVAGIIGVVLLVLFGAVAGIGEAVYGFSQPVCYFLIGILTLGLAVHHSGLAERMAVFLMRGAVGSPYLLYMQMLFSFAALTFALPSASTRGAIMVHVYEQVLEQWHVPQGHPFYKATMMAMGSLNRLGSTALLAGGITPVVASGLLGDFSWTQWFVIMSVPFLREPGRGRDDTVPVLPRRLPPGGHWRRRAGAAGPGQAGRNPRRPYRHFDCADVVHGLRARAASGRAGADCAVPDTAAAGGHTDVGRV